MKPKSESKNRWCLQFKQLLAMRAAVLLLCLVALTLVLTGPARAETPPAAIPFSDIGAKATADYQGDALSITATSDGARLARPQRPGFAGWTCLTNYQRRPA